MSHRIVVISILNITGLDVDFVDFYFLACIIHNSTGFRYLSR